LVTNLWKGEVSDLVDVDVPIRKLRSVSQWILVALEDRGRVYGLLLTSLIITDILFADLDQEGFLESDAFVVFECDDKINLPLAQMLFADAHQNYVGSLDLHEGRGSPILHKLERIELLAAIEGYPIINRSRVLKKGDRLLDVHTVELDTHWVDLLINELSCLAGVFSDSDLVKNFCEGGY